MATSRREFLLWSAAGLAACATSPSRKRIPPDRPIRIGVAGTGNRGRANLLEMKGESVVAVCDVDAGFLRQGLAEFPAARGYRDYRELLAQEELDALLISTPDHTHACIATQALARGLDVYCEKPLAHDVHEVRAMQRLAARHGAVTQMGTQIHALPNYRRVVEAVQSHKLGPIRDVHVFVNGSQWSGGAHPAPAEPPPHLDWDLWLGPAPARAYAPGYHPAGWRRWWEFGGGTMADMACHYMDLAFWALGLPSPLRVKASGPPPHPEGAPPGLRVHYEFPGGLVLCWYDGDQRPALLAELGLGDWQNGVLFRGERGWLISDYTKHAVGPAAFAAAWVPPLPVIPPSPGHHQEWLAAIRTRERTSCDFAYAGLLTEAVLLGVASYRAQEELVWDPERGRVTNTRAADPFLRREPRAGFELAE